MAKICRRQWPKLAQSHKNRKKLTHTPYPLPVDTIEHQQNEYPWSNNGQETKIDIELIFSLVALFQLVSGPSQI